jgi:hypothetical protein
MENARKRTNSIFEAEVMIIATSKIQSVVWHPGILRGRRRFSEKMFMLDHL